MTDINDKVKTLGEAIKEAIKSSIARSYYKAIVKIENDKVYLEPIEKQDFVRAFDNGEEVYINVRGKKPKYLIEHLKQAIVQLYEILLREVLLRKLDPEEAEELIEIIKWAKGEEQ